VAIVALVAGSELFGIWGALFGAPLAGLVQAIVVAGIKEMRLAGAGDPAQSAQVREAEGEGRTMAEGRAGGATHGRVRTVLTTVARARRRLRRETAPSIQRADGEGR